MNVGVFSPASPDLRVKRRFVFAMLACSFGAGSTCLNAAEITENLVVHGFLSQAYIDTSNNNFFGRSDGGSFDFRELGINGYWQSHENLNLAAQVISRNAGRESDSDPRFDYALADLHFYSDTGNRSGIRLGRIKVPLGLLNQTRDAPSARPGIFVPASVYFDQFRNALVSTDGYTLYTTLSQSWGDLSLELYQGNSDPGDREMEYFVFKQDAPGRFDDASMQGLQLRYDALGSGIRLALSYSRPSLDYQPAAAGDPLHGGDVISDMLLYSAQYNGEKISLTAEFLLMINNVKNFGPLYNDFRAKGESYYVHADYRYRPDLTFSVRYGEQIVNDKDRDGDKSITFNPDHVGFAHTVMLGVRWDFAPDWILRGEFHHTNGTAWLSGSDNPNLLSNSRRWDTLAVQLVYSF